MLMEHLLCVRHLLDGVGDGKKNDKSEPPSCSIVRLKEKQKIVVIVQ